MGRPRDTKTKDWDQVTIRLPDGMRDRINQIAEKNKRSANAEIVLRLERSLSSKDNPDIVAMRECFQAELAKAIEILSARKKDS